MKGKIMALLDKISKKLESFTFPTGGVEQPQSEEELDAYIASLEAYRDSIKAYQELKQDFIELNTLLAKELPHADPNVVMFYHRANALSEMFHYKLGEAQLAPVIKGIEQEINQAKAFMKKLEEKKDQG